VAPNQYEVIYANMPMWGLAKAGIQVPAVDRLSGARDRMGNSE
jgi:hypothetical protein